MCRGIKRVDAETIRSYLGITPGQSFSNADIDEAVKRLFGTGMFSDVRINQSGSTLVVQVDEHSIVNQVLFQGNKKIKDAQLAQAVQLKPRAAFSNAAMEADAEAIRQAYSRIGRDDATVNTRSMDLGEGRVNVVYRDHRRRPHQDRPHRFQRQQRVQRSPARGRHLDQAFDDPLFPAARRRL